MSESNNHCCLSKKDIAKKTYLINIIPFRAVVSHKTFGDVGIAT